MERVGLPKHSVLQIVTIVVTERHTKFKNKRSANQTKDKQKSKSGKQTRKHSVLQIVTRTLTKRHSKFKNKRCANKAKDKQKSKSSNHVRRNFKDTNPLMSSLLVVFVWGGETIL